MKIANAQWTGLRRTERSRRRAPSLISQIAAIATRKTRSRLASTGVPIGRMMLSKGITQSIATKPKRAQGKRRFVSGQSREPARG